jgi:hypothetical protein
MESVVAEQSFSELAGQVCCLYEMLDRPHSCQEARFKMLGGHQLVAVKQMLKKFSNASVEHSSSFTSCVGCFG